MFNKAKQLIACHKFVYGRNRKKTGSGIKIHYLLANCIGFVYGPCTCTQQCASHVHGPYIRSSRRRVHGPRTRSVHGPLYTVVYTPVNTGVSTAVFTCTRPCACRLHTVYMSRVQYTAVCKLCTRILQGRARVVNMAVYTARTARSRACTGCVHVCTATYTAVYVHVSCTRRPCTCRVCTRPVYVARTRPSARPCTCRVHGWAVYADGLQVYMARTPPLHGHVRPVTRAVNP